MHQACEKCNRRYNDEYCSTICPHRGIGFCKVCDCVICVCTEESCSDWERSSNYTLQLHVDGRMGFDA